MPVNVITIAGLEREIISGSLVVQAVLNGVDTLTADVQSEDASVRPVNGQEVLWVENGTTRFGGVIVNPRERAMTGWGVPIVTEITVHDFSVYCKRRVVSAEFPAQTLKERLTTLVADYLATFGISLDAGQPDGPDLEAAIYDTRLDQVLTDLANSVTPTPWVWKVSALKALLMQAPTAVAAPYDIAPSDGNTVGDIVVEAKEFQPVNRVIISGGPFGEFRVATDERHYGDGVTRVFPLLMPLDWSDTGIRLMIGGMPSIATWAGHHPADSPEPEWSYDPVNYTINQGSFLTPLGPTDYFETSYRAFYWRSGLPIYHVNAPWTFIVEDLADQALVGIFEQVIDRQDIPDRFQLVALGNAALRPSSSTPLGVEYVTRGIGLWPGQLQHILEPYRQLDDDVLITEVQVRDISYDLYERTITATTKVQFDGSFRDTYQEWWEGQGGGAVSSPDGTFGAPAGDDTEVQFNDSGIFGADPSFTFDKTAKVLTLDSVGALLKADAASSGFILDLERKGTNNVSVLRAYHEVLGTSRSIDLYFDRFGAAELIRSGATSSPVGLSISDINAVLGLQGQGVVIGAISGAVNSQSIILQGLVQLYGLAPLSSRITGTSSTIDSGIAGGAQPSTCIVFAPSGTHACGLPAISSYPISPGTGLYRVLFLKNSSATDTVTLTANGSDLIDELTTYTLLPGRAVVLGVGHNASNTAGWRVLAEAGQAGPHATTHQQGGSDPIKLDDLATPDDNTDLDASTSRHGLLRKLPNNSSLFLDGLGNFTDPGTGSGSGNVTDTTPFGSEPAGSPGPAAGDLVLYNNAPLFGRFNGLIWVPHGPIFPLTAPVNGDFAWINQGGASVDTTNGGIYLLGPATSGFNARIRKKAAPATPYTITAVFLTTQISLAFQDVGICFRQSSDGKCHALTLGCGNATAVLGSDKFTSATAFSATYVNRSIVGMRGPMVFLRIADNGTNRICSFSTDGQHFIQFHSIGRTDFLTANEVGFFVNDQTNVYALGATLLSWKEA